MSKEGVLLEPSDHESQPAFSRDESLNILSNQRRRFVLHHLKQSRGSTDLSTLSQHVASWETRKPADTVTAMEKKRVQNALQQHHLPKMEQSGFIEYEPETRDVRLTDDAEKYEFVVDILPNRGISWGEYYLLMAGLAVVGLVGFHVGLTPLASMTPTHWGLFVVTAFTISAVIHAYDARYRMRIGASDKPPEVDNQ